MAVKLSTILQGLKAYYSAPLASSFKKFRAGVIYFATGMIIVYLAHTALEPSLKQELIVLAGLLMIAIGFFVAIMAHVHMVISRIIRFFSP